ncbi:hypothetical protein MHU86_8376 [Fragilaria crotonensis]|nr:hypothetical protein MHU86_8376 [Fragilaria crotonensis]
MSQHILALGSVPVNHLDGSSSSGLTRLESKQLVTQHRQSIPPNSISSLVFWIQADELPTVYDPMELAGWVPLLVKDDASTVEFKIVGDETTSLATIHTSLLLAGLKATSERREGDVRMLTAHRKATTLTISQPISLGGAKNAVSIDDDDGDDDLIDEDDLLNDTTLGAPSMEPRTVKGGDDCSGRKACDNCSCGRAEAEAGGSPVPVLTKEELVQKTSSCGNCAKGDAFRCASCPYLGKPAFKAGQEHLVLDLMDDF